MNTNTFESVFKYLELTKRSNVINTWLLGINSAILFYIIKNSLDSNEIFESLILLKKFKIAYILLTIWISINVILLIIYSYKEKILSLIIEDKYFRLKSLMSYMENVKISSEEELLKTSIFETYSFAKDIRSQKVIGEYVNKISKYHSALLKWSNKRLIIYRFVILGTIPLAFVSLVIITNKII